MHLIWIALALVSGGTAAFIAYWSGVGVAERRLIGELDCALALYQDAETKARTLRADLDALITATGALTADERDAFDRIAARYIRGAA